ncbi:hypothetical protein M5K25_028377 [Dendrobium thyrsiflorum]|uniref:Uncharacterized protein n=1 Tax=Dendrobium thyrsiflorum TaxID=117978 RepID=A0ABD0TTD9_DENTH
MQESPPARSLLSFGHTRDSRLWFFWLLNSCLISKGNECCLFLSASIDSYIPAIPLTVFLFVYFVSIFTRHTQHKPASCHQLIFTLIIRIRKHGIFHLSEPSGVSVIRNCQARGFHPHEEPSDGSPIYEHCSHVLMNTNLNFDVVDLRNK